MSAPPAVAAARARAYDELFECVLAIAKRMVVFAFLGLIAAGLMLVMAVLVYLEGSATAAGAVPIVIMAVVTGACSFFLRRAADRYDDAHSLRNVDALAEGVRYETAYWRTSAICALVMVAATAIPVIGARMVRGLKADGAPRTVEDMRVIGAALERYAAEHHAYPNAQSPEVLATVLRPYLQTDMPRVDGWKRPYIYQPACLDDRCFDYRLISHGANGVADVRVESLHEPRYACEACPVPAHDLEIVHGGGRFLLMPPSLREAND